jgi:hypothetical protein
MMISEPNSRPRLSLRRVVLFLFPSNHEDIEGIQGQAPLLGTYMNWTTHC